MIVLSTIQYSALIQIYYIRRYRPNITSSQDKLDILNESIMFFIIYFLIFGTGWNFSVGEFQDTELIEMMDRYEFPYDFHYDMYVYYKKAELLLNDNDQDDEDIDNIKSSPDVKKLAFQDHIRKEWFDQIMFWLMLGCFLFNIIFACYISVLDIWKHENTVKLRDYIWKKY